MEKVNPFRRTILITWVLMWINNYYMIMENRVVFDEVKLIYLTNSMQAITCFWVIYNVQKEFLDILKIRLFCVKPYKKDKKIE